MEKELKAFRKLIVWQRAHSLTLAMYKASEKFPKHEMFGLTSQIRRAAVSIESNIVEGYALLPPRVNSRLNCPGMQRINFLPAITKEFSFWLLGKS
jgi:hypothetical protein